MNQNQTEYFKELLKKRLEELLQQSGILLTELVNRNSKEIEYLDCASFDFDQNMKIRIKSRESRLIKKIQAALDRLENNIYGICESCGENISLRRLEARPVTTKCIYCKTEEEKMELLVG
ncbi:MAG: RNA polymerase-binding protein DksA [Desulfobacula sp.]|jgi:DnaK suppressor protein|uniref:TraR/DksA C4-type zinc finger protein n=1 Tax=Desulfobacula sp. TaxID=2593537 RepID=UPI001D98ED7C|nr:RNA polymerase-binding protein DksA [Desulfobacula sp.]MBT3484458.1 RNA polymerase-binding protein DksA [Desulfobacula sp.]MBT3803096.1 RNA polymerase-binding protein DksA [Desulfobacula sp.]MBT4024666.1 RNA polymerase-binding protein DksA [Desulfobacula sp.]MBT4197144.1 RNA polymerase-binding protein DksA [Desulfobacula sp.]